MAGYDKECIEVFLKNQLQLFPEIVAEDEQEAEEFLEDCMAVVCHSPSEVKKYFEENMDVSNMSMKEILEEAEVFPLSRNRYLIVEG